MKKLIFTSLIFASLSAFAGTFQGNWAGQGNLKDPSGASIKCEQIKFVVKQSPEAINIEQGYIQCKPQEMTVAPIRALIKNGALYMDNKKVGTISEDTVILNYKNDQGVNVRSKAQLTETGMTYREEWLDNQGKVMLIFTGALIRAQ